jgi:ADP-ribose pyrophosphatase YjhB (NUDIX family)
MQPIIRPTGILMEGNRILLVKQDVTESRHWALPGGRLEFGETIERCLIREIKEETGLDVLVRELLYVCDRIHQNSHVVHMTFLLEKTGGKIRTSHESQLEKEKIKQVEMVPFDRLREYGFSSTFQELVKSNFPERGSYKGDFKKFYGTW